MDKRMIAKSKRLSYLLRHSTLPDTNGWMTVKQLEKEMFSYKELEEIVEKDNKNRYDWSADKQALRARQGHSNHVKMDFHPTRPPEVLYHGTAASRVGSIMKEGIKSMTRQFVHLSPMTEVAVQVGKRHGSPAVLTVDAAKMNEEGICFYQSTNGVWLTEYVSPDYIVKPNIQ